MAKKATKKKPADPQPIERDTYTQVDREPHLCPYCGHAGRTDYQKVRHLDGPVSINGKAYDRVEWRRTSCKKCRRKRIDRTLYPLGSVRQTVGND